jgi:hypothetical protein
MLTAETVDRIVKFTGCDLPVTSIYASVDAGPGRREDLQVRVSSMLDQIRPVSKNGSLGHAARLSVRADIGRIKAALAEDRWKPGAMAIFSCSGRDLYEEVALPRPVRDRVMVDTVPYVRPMLSVLDELHRICVVVVDKASACVWEIYGGEMRELRRLRDQALRKPNFARGPGEYRVRNKDGELSKRHYRNVAQALDELLRSGDFDVLIVGGHDYAVPAFIEFLPVELRGRIAGTFCVDPDVPASEIRTSAGDIAARYERDQDRQLIASVFERVAGPGQLGAVGLSACLWAGSLAAAQTLVVMKGAQKPGVVCDESRWLGLSGDTCPVCGKPTRASSDVIAELVEVVAGDSGKVRHIDGDDRLAACQVAAALRFKLPPPR